MMTNSSNIGLTCDACGRTVQGITFMNGMKFCAKCYQETFGNNYSQVDIMNAQYIEQLKQENAQLKKEIETIKDKICKKIISHIEPYYAEDLDYIYLVDGGDSSVSYSSLKDILDDIMEIDNE